MRSGAAAPGGPASAGEQGERTPPPPPARRPRAGIAALLAAKARRTPAQRKIGSGLLALAAAEAPRRSRRQSPEGAGPAVEQVPDGPAGDGRLRVDIRADVTPAVLARIRELGGSVVDSVPGHRSVRALLPAASIERLAALDAVRSIRRADGASTAGQAPPSPFVTRRTNATQGDVAHRANLARTTHGVDGTGIGIGVISDGVRSLAERQAAGDLPARVTVLPGQQGGPLSLVGLVTGRGGDEGTAMLEIVHDLAPGAELYFATGRGGEARLAQNIEDLCAAGADIIVDDIFYFQEPVFQDGVVAQAVNDAAADGCFHFSAAGNAGNLNDGTSGVWEGDYAAGTDFEVDGASVGTAHDFGSGVEENQLTKDGLAFVLQWADPLGASDNDYDLFLVDADDNVLASSTNTQDGTQDPIEHISSSADYTDAYLVVVKASGAASRYLRLDTLRGQLAVATDGQTARHAAAENAVTVGAVDVRTAAGAGGVFNGTESIRTDSSDGPRRMFFEPDGTPITAGNFSSTGGEALQKPDLVAATCVSTAAPEFATFCGTSSAAPHAAGIGALLLEAAGGPAKVALAGLRTALTGSALDIEATGVDRDSGAGIVMAPGAVDALDVAEADRNGAPTVEGTLSVATLAPGGDAVTLSVASAFADPDSDTLTYTALSTDSDYVTAGMSGATLTLTPLAPGRIAVRVRATDPDGLSAVQTVTVTVAAGTRDYDTDDDGFIEIAHLAQLDAMRYDRDGDGVVDRVADWTSYYATSAFAEGALDMGCPAGCVGYELDADLDFDTNASGDADAGDDHWNDGEGWLPFPVRFSIEGHGHAIANLFINRPMQAGSVALFGSVWTPAAGQSVGLSGIRLVDVDVTGNVNVGGLVGTLPDSGFITGSRVTGRVQGTDKVGGLVGHNRGDISASHATGHVSGTTSVGGLVGYNDESISGSYATGEVTGDTAVGGLVGANWASITTSYSTARVTGEEQVGGLVGRNSVFADIVAGYATGRVSGTSRVGGLAGDNLESISASYATGPVSGETLVGGLTGFVNGSVTASYWDTTTSGVATSAGGSGVTTTALQSPTGASGIYGTWSADHWRFGTAAQYPALAVDVDGGGEATWQELGHQLRDGPVLTATAIGGNAVELSWTAVDVSHWTPAPDVAYALTRDDGTTVAVIGEALTGSTHTDTGLTDGATYTYQVSAVVADGEATRSAPRSVTAVDNWPPTAVGILLNRTLPVPDGSLDVDVSGSFSDLDNDVLTYGAISSAPTVASVSVSGSRLTVMPLSGGTATITVTATDVGGSGTSAVQTFMVTVPNRPPLAVGTLANRSREVPDGVFTVDVSGAFRDPDGDDLTYGASSSATSVASATLSGSRVSVTPLSRGTATITVTATDAGGSSTSVTQTFTVTVANQAPVAVGTLPPLSLRAGGVQSVNAADAFEDPDDDPLTFEASSSDPLVATASARGSTVRLSAIWPGTAEVTVRAEDPAGLRAEQSFELTVPNRPPVPVGTLPGLSLALGAAEASVEMSGAFEDPEDDPLTYGASSSEEAVATVVVSGSTVLVTPLSAGTAIVTVTATDVGGSNTAATQRFGVGVDRPPPRIGGGVGVGGGGVGGGRRSNEPPEAVGSLADWSLTLGASPATVDLAAAFRDPDGDALTYAASPSAGDVAMVVVEGSVVTVVPVGAGTAVVTVTASDGEEENAPATRTFTVTVAVDYDADADGLIEVRTLAQLDALRHDLDGDGVPVEAGAEAHAAAFEGAVHGLTCAGGCRGYELLADLDFDTNGSGVPDAGDAYWRDGSGWLPIGTAAEPFSTALEGNGRVIRRLFVAGGEGAGLFGATAPSSVVARVGLIAADVTGTRAVGALAGVNGGRVTAGWATGRVSGTAAVGGLVGSNAGFVGGSHAAVAVSGERQAGGLAGVNEGSLRAVHATGGVSGTGAVGGLIGHNRGTLTASYATGRVRGEREAGGLVGAASPPGAVTAGYWDTETSGVASSAAGRGLTTSALQGQTAYGGLYASWNVDVDADRTVDGPWHLGTGGQYPALSLDVDGDGRASWQELGRQLRAGPTLTAAAAAVPAGVVLTWTAADTGAWTPPPTVTYTVTRETGTVVETVGAVVRGARYVDSEVQPGRAYTYQVAAVVDGGEAARSARVTVGVPCTYTVTPLHRDVLWTAGTEQVAVTTAPGCAWTAASESAFLAVTAGTAGTGPGTVRYTVAANTGGPRRGALALAGRRATVYQASPTAFTDHPIERGVTPVKAIHFLELRARIDALRTGAGRPAFGWTDPLLTPGATPIRRVHLTELRAALSEAYAAAGRAAPAYTDPLISPGATVIRAAHLMELRAAVAALE